ncbi:uncharacterized protein geminin isoform X2 [Epargyreus clarus]
MPKTRRSLKTLQHTATDRENLVGRPSKNLKHQISLDSPVEVEVKRKIVQSKETQANFTNKVTAEDLTNPKGASESYWKILSEKRQKALEETLEENEKLKQEIDALKEENAKYKVMLEEANSFIEVFKEELQNCGNDDTGIDVNDVSTADEANDEEHKSDE